MKKMDSCLRRNDKCCFRNKYQINRHPHIPIQPYSHTLDYLPR